ncbi:nickel-dependent hydrogenase large subunit [Streptomyces laculatispora]|uniref:Nickel-dependent hydrogenase large subunit n=1 Tax=Streptomyces laculatispora TaxID=887464 RepID=A0ABY9IDK8_9ACTN|nr:nickel-dependent hydrogenase large subunit [Streptomyces laculatispora]WLQ44925.1 nickel-dependent hydrogenase large subunit [Streptomyces laculatispora]
MTHRDSRVLKVGSLARVEGEGALHLRMDGGEVAEARLAIYEPPRFFEAFLRGRSYAEPPDITSRVCGICPVAYQMSACRAIEDACGVVVDGQLAALRRLLYCGEWIESQTLHIYLLHAPDFFGCDSAIDLARTRRADIERGLRLKQAGNAILELLGGRAIHPVNVRLGGFHRIPSTTELRPLTDRLRRARDDAAQTVRWVAGFEFPDAGCDNDLFALSEPGTYAIESGTPTVMPAPHTGCLPPESDRALPTRTFGVHEFGAHVAESQVPHSTALHSLLDNRRHLTGSLARYAISGRWLSPIALQAAYDAGLGDPRQGTVCRNPFRSIIVRAVEVLYAVDEALRIIDAYEPPPHPYVDVPSRAGTGHGATEAPRGLLYHRYTLDSEGIVTDASLVPPTAQNLGAIEEDLRRIVQERLGDGDPTDAELTALCERAVRNHDPCISCSAHFLNLTVERT